MSKPLPATSLRRQAPLLHRSLRVEFIGLPGSGKTTIATRTAQHLQRRGEVVNLMLVSARSSRLGRARNQQAALSYLALRHPEQLLTSIKAFGAPTSSSPGSRTRLRLNWCLHLARWYRLAGSPGIHLLDQGLLQVIWSLGFEHGPAAVERFHARSPQAYPAPEVVVLVTATEDRLLTRLQERGGRNAFSRAADGSPGIETIYERGRAALEGVVQLIDTEKRSRLISVDNDEDGSLEGRADALAVELQRLHHLESRNRGGTASAVFDV